MSAKSASRNLQVSSGLLSNYGDDDDFCPRALSPVGSASAHVSIEMHDVPSLSQQTTRSLSAKGQPEIDNRSYTTSSFTNDNTVLSNNVSPSTGVNMEDTRQITVISRAGQQSDTAIGKQTLLREIRKSPELDTVSTSPSDVDSLSQSITLPKSMSSRQSTDLELPLSINSRNSSQSGNKSGTSGSILDESEYYCVDHMTLCSAQVRKANNCISHATH